MRTTGLSQCPTPWLLLRAKGCRELQGLLSYDRALSFTLRAGKDSGWVSLTLLASVTCSAREVGKTGSQPHSPPWVPISSVIQKSRFSVKRRKELDLANKYYFNIAPNKLGNIIRNGGGGGLCCPALTLKW